MTYHVVFEYTSLAGCYAGVRFSIPYYDQQQFEETAPHQNKKILGINVSEDERFDLVSLTPEISFITLAIQESCFTSDSSVDIFTLEHNLSVGAWGISQYRYHIIAKGLTRVTEFEKCLIGPENTEKNRLLSWAIRHSDQKTGQIDLAVTSVRLNFEAYHIVSRRGRF